MASKVDRSDVSEPYAEVKTGVDSQGSDLWDLEDVTGDDLVGQRVHRVAFTNPGELRHRPEFGAGLKSHQSEPQTPSREQAILRDFDRSLATLPFVDDWSVTIRRDASGVSHIEPSVRSDGRDLQVPEVTLD